MSRWFRHYAGMMRDEKLVRAAMRANQPVERVAWVYGAILESATEVNDGGRYDFDPAEAAYFLRASADDIMAILDALSSLERVAGGRVAKWGDRQYQSDSSATRQKAYRDRQKDNADADRSVSDSEVTVSDRHGDGEVTPPETETETKVEERKIRRKAPRRISYPPRFEVFWSGYPTDKLMSKSEAFTEWQKLSSEDQEAAIASLPAFKAATAKLGPDHRVIHACRFLSKRRFDAFAEAAAKIQAVTEAASTRVYVKYDSDPGDAWSAHFRAMGKVPPRDQHGGWWFDTEYPPGNVQRETTEAA